MLANYSAELAGMFMLTDEGFMLIGDQLDYINGMMET